MPKSAETSKRMSSIAGQYLNVTDKEIIAAITTDAGLKRLREDIRSMAATSLRQTGFKAFIKRIVG